MVRVHPAASLLPRMPAAEFDALVEDIRVNGQRMPVLLAGGLIVDGRHRWEACERIGIECMTESIDIDDAAALVRSLNVHRRHLTESQRAIVAAGLATLSEGRPSETASIEAVSQADAAELLNVSRSAVQRATKVRDEGAPELIAAVTSGEVSVSAAAEVATLPPAEQTEIVAKGEKAIISAAKDILAKRATERLVKRVRPKPAAPKVSEADTLKARIAELEQALTEARDAAADAGALAQDLLMQIEGEADKRLEQLRAELKATQVTRDIALRENAALKREVKRLQRQVGVAQ